MESDEAYTMIIAIVQAQDAENASDALVKLGANVIKLPSMGGFLGRKNTTLMIGIPAEKVEKAFQELKTNCRQRVEYISIPLESAPLPLPAPTPVTIGGATVFSLELDKFEEI